MIAMSTEESRIGAGLSTSSGKRFSYQDAISNILNIFFNIYVSERIISDYKAMGWDSVNNLLNIKDLTGFVFPLIVFSFIYNLRKTFIGLCLIQLILLIYMYGNLLDVCNQAALIRATNVSAFYLSYAESLLFIVLVSSVIQGLFHWLKSKKKGPAKKV